MAVARHSRVKQAGTEPKHPKACPLEYEYPAMRGRKQMMRQGHTFQT
jgi:hypothetical protein